MAIQKTTIKPIDFWHFMAKGTLNGLQLKARGQSIKNLASFAEKHSQVSHKLWEHLIEVNPAKIAQFVLFPSHLLNKADIVAKINKVPLEKMLVEMKSAKGKIAILDLGKLDILARMLKPKGVTEEEIQNLSILSDLSKLYFKHYLFVLRKGKAHRVGDEAEKDKFQFNINELRRELPWLIERLMSVRRPYRREIVNHLKDAIRLHDEKKPSAANASLLAAWTKLEAEADRMEKVRLAKRRKKKEKRISKIIEISVSKLRLSHYGIERLPDGTWIDPQKGYRKYSDDIWVKEEKKTRVKEEDVLRKTQHIIESISSEIEKNSGNMKILILAKDILERHQKKLEIIPDYEVLDGEKMSIKSMISPSLEHYMNAIIKRKKTAANRFEITLSLIDASLFKQAISMINMAVEHLEDRNIELSGQKTWFIKKGKVEKQELIRLIKKEEYIKSKIGYTVRLFSTWQLNHYPRMRGTATNWIEKQVIPLASYAVEPGFRNAETCFKEAAKALRNAANWSERKPGWISRQRIPKNKIREIGEANTKRMIVRAAKWLLAAEWCINNKYEEIMDPENLWEIGEKMAKQNEKTIEAIKKLE